MKVGAQVLLMVFIMLFTSGGIMAGDARDNHDSTATDSLSRWQIRKQNRKAWRKELNAANRRFFIKANLVNANLDTRISFQLLGNFLTASIGFEDDLGLPDRRNFISGSFLGRITPTSGIYAEYYGLRRNVVHTTSRDVIFLGDTIPAGTTSGSYFNTQMFSAGYLLSLMKSPDAFLGIYFNLLLMDLDAGIYSDYQNLDRKIDSKLPFPTFGLIAAFQLKEWITFNGSVGFFAFRLQALDESLYDFSLSLNFRPKSWLGLSIGYQEFDIRVIFPKENYDVRVDYNFRGPSFGIDFSF